MIPIRKSHITIKANHRKVVARFLDPKAERMSRIHDSILKMDEQVAIENLAGIVGEFGHRHDDFEAVLQRHFERIQQRLGEVHLSEAKRLLLGAYFTHEYSIEGAALFNPSIVPHPDQTHLDPGQLRFIMSLRAVGEGHISSITFRTGVIGPDGGISLEPDADKWTCGAIQANEMLGSGYDVIFGPSSRIEERVIFPFSKRESNGMEDIRFVLFDDGNRLQYIGSYTAYDGKEIQTQLVETEDFVNFQVRMLKGKAISGKGMALFPEKIGNNYVMLGRQGGQCISIMFSPDLHQWDDHEIIQLPVRDWELFQLGNCGSPIKTPKGWLILTHAVGPMRKYVFSATLLDLNDPSKVLATLDKPLLSAEGEEREGYVPNVVYTCGWIQNGDKIVIPYAMSDRYIGIAGLDTMALLEELLKSIQT